MPSGAELLGMYPDASYYAFQLPPRRPWRERLKRWTGLSHEPRDPVFARTGRLLDFGCGAGDYLLRMRQRGWECAGIEVNQSALEVARSHGLQVATSLGGPDGYPDAWFDFVRANHSLEHLSDPGVVVAEMFRVLKPGGVLFIGVPRNDSLNSRLFGPYWWHLCAPVHPITFSTRGLIGLVRSAGFEVVRTSTNSDTGSLTGSVQIYLNRNSGRRSDDGLLFRLKPLLAIGQWLARLEDLLGVGDKLELIARRPA